MGDDGLLVGADLDGERRASRLGVVGEDGEVQHVQAVGGELRRESRDEVRILEGDDPPP